MKATRSILSLLLAGLMLMASVGVMVNSHICGGEVKSVAIYAEPDSCTPCKGAEHHAMKNGCCEETCVIVKSEEHSGAARIMNELSPSFAVIAVVLPVLYLIDFDVQIVSAPEYALYKPPLPDRDITVFVQSFLI